MIGIVETKDVSELIPVLFGGLFVGVFALAITTAIRQRKRAAANLLRVADELRLEFRRGTARGPFGKGAPSVEGVVDGRPIRIHSYTTGSGKQRTQWCAISLTATNPGGLSLRISGENVLTKAGRAFGIDDVEVGDPVFDKTFFVKANKPEFIRAALIPEVRERFLAARRTGARGTITVEGAEVKYAEVGSFSNEKLARRIPTLVALLSDVALITGAARA